MHYCLNCGNALRPMLQEERPREICPDCGWIYYEQLKVGAGALIEQDGQVLLIRRGIDPWRGLWCLPAGYVEVDESPARAAEREAREETGLQVSAGDLFDVYFFEDDPRGNGVLVLYECSVLGGELETNGENLEYGYFSPEEIPAEITGAGHQAALQDWVKRRKAAR
jgi:ADP-ribose pyrophosphatase YjhB (NUDIX family)